MYRATIELLKNGQKGDVIAVAMATMTFKYGGYLRFKLVYLENQFGDPHFLFYKTLSYITINYVTNFKKFCPAKQK